MDYTGAQWWIEVGSETVALDGGWFWLEPLTMEADEGMSQHAIRLVIDSALAPESWQQIAGRCAGQTSQLCCQLRGQTCRAPVRRLAGRLAPSSMVFTAEGAVGAEAAGMD